MKKVYGTHIVAKIAHANDLATIKGMLISKGVIPVAVDDVVYRASYVFHIKGSEFVARSHVNVNINEFIDILRSVTPHLFDN